MIIKKEDYNTGATKFLMDNFIKNLQNRCLIMSQKAPYQEKYEKLKNALSENFKNILSKKLIKNLKKTVPYQGTLTRV